MKILHTADWHLGSFRGPEENGVNLRSQDTIKCLEEMVRVAQEEKPELVLVSGDIFDKAEIWQGRSHKEVLQARKIILDLSAAAKYVIIMRGTPNHDSSEAFAELEAHFDLVGNVEVVAVPKVVSVEEFDIAVLPGFDRGVYRAKFPGLSKEEENEVFTHELSNIVLGLKAQCDPEKKSILMSHYTVPGCNTESGQVMMLTQFEPILPLETLQAADFDLVALGHIHRPQKVPNLENCYYSGAINAMNFNDEGQERGFWIHESTPIGWVRDFYKTPYREFMTIHLNDDDIGMINAGAYDMVGTQRWRGEVDGKIARVIYSCTYENNKALNKASLERQLLDDGAFMVKEILPEKIGESADRSNMFGTTDPEVNLREYLEEKQYPEEKIQELILKARPVIAEAEAGISMSAATGTFEPVEISVKNYRNYEEETFNFEDISFCTINGQNGAGKSSLFMDAIIDCLYEEPREGDLTSWIRNDEKARSGAIMFTFRIGEKTFRVTRTRARSGKGTLNLAELVDGEWTDRSKEKYKDTQTEIINILGMDSLTFKSCALIMQDQYGLFLQAPKEDRMIILGNLLGLGIYQAMEKISYDKAKVFGAKKRNLEQEIDIHETTIKGHGEPEARIRILSEDIEGKERLLKSKTEERDKKKLALSHQQEAAERRNKLSASVRTLESKKAAAEQNKASQQDIINASSAILDGRTEIEAKVAEYNSFLEKEKEFSAEAALYSAKQAEVAELEKQARYEEVQMNDLKTQLQSAEGKKAALEIPVDEKDIRDRNSEYEKYSELLRQAKELQTRFVEAKSERDRRAYAVDSKKAYINQETARLSSKKADLERRTELLQNSGCPDIENAECRFLADALEAKKQLPAVEAEIDSFQAEQEPLLQELIAAVEEAEKAILAVGYDEKLLAEYSAKVKELSDAPEQLKKLEERANQIALISASSEHIQSNISDCEKRLATVKLKASAAAQEQDKYKKAFEEYAIVQSNIQMLKPWLDREKQLPVAEERKSTAMSRFLELADEIVGIDNEISEKKADIEKEEKAMAGIEELTAAVTGMNIVIDAVNSDIRNMQMEVGALKQKLEQIEELTAEIDVLRQKKNEAAAETADYDVLKSAFSQDGIPHQIVRSILPQLTATANNILGQMTGGKMGIEFKTEKILKSNSKKEVVTLDIFIEEYGKSSLPYLSKSGGEKVKSSLSVILALAETKSSSAGIQLGMLFIDEPPFLDGDGIQAYCDALETIQSRYENIKIMAITHDPTMKARFPQNLDVVKTEHGSKVIY
ncbi:MAG: AAA family ATPase [Clostridium sp.]|nr:AAA family ATPase [Clostridium sp.]